MEFHAAKGDKPPYLCAECGEPVLVIQGLNGTRLYKPCGHADAAVLANLEAIVYGEGGAK